VLGERVMEAGAFDYILKPFQSLGELRNRIQRALERSRLKKEKRALGDFPRRSNFKLTTAE
jgi:DNA-binding response OmpR family regulator